MVSKEELQRQAQGKLVEARKLIREAGELAKEGQFPLTFGEIGNFTPRSAFDLEQYRADAEAEVRKNGRYDRWDSAKTAEHPYGKSVYTPWEDLSEDERSAAVLKVMKGYQSEDLPNEVSEWGLGAEDIADRWWHPSRC